MGCGGSKTIAVREPTNVSDDKVKNRNELHPDINLIVDSHQDDIGVNSYNNAKPRLVNSAVRRNIQTEIKPVVNDSNQAGIDDPNDYNAINISRSNSTSHMTGDTLRNSDSGLGHTSALSASTERSRPKSSTTPYKSRTRTPNFGNKSIDSCNRPDSGKTGSILTTNALNASFMTTGDDDISCNVDVTLDLHTPFSEYTDVEESTFRTLSITPSTPGMPVEPTPVMFNKQIGVIREESEGGFTPRSIDYIEEVNKSAHGNSFLPTYLPREIFSHNEQAGKREWIIYRRKAYDRNLIISKFSPIVKEYLEIRIQDRERLLTLMRQKFEKRKQQKDEKLEDNEVGKELETSLCYGDTDIKEEKKTEGELHNSHDSVSLSSNDDDCGKRELAVNEAIIFYAQDFENIQTWNEIGIESLLRLHLDTNNVNTNISVCCVGDIVQPNTPRYWNDVRKDVRMVLEEINQRQESCNEYIVDLKEQYEAWLRHFGDCNPSNPQTPEGDPNKRVFLLPQRISDKPLSLRGWLDEWVEFDFENPEWHLLPPCIMDDDVLTSDQEAVENKRTLRNDLQDGRRMEKRRRTLMNYFMTKYEMQVSDIEDFTRWATSMAEGERAFNKLCELEL